VQAFNREFCHAQIIILLYIAKQKDEHKLWYELVIKLSAIFHANKFLCRVISECIDVVQSCGKKYLGLNSLSHVRYEYRFIVVVLDSHILIAYVISGLLNGNRDLYYADYHDTQNILNFLLDIFMLIFSTKNIVFSIASPYNCFFIIYTQ